MLKSKKAKEDELENLKTTNETASQDLIDI